MPFLLANARPLWPVVLVMTVILGLGLPFLLRILWPGMKPRTRWIIALIVAVFFAFIIAPTMIALSNNIRAGRSM